MHRLPGVWDGEGKAAVAGKPFSGLIIWQRLQDLQYRWPVQRDLWAKQEPARAGRINTAQTPPYNLRGVCRHVLGPQRCSRGPKPRHFLSYIITGCQKWPTEDGVSMLQQLRFTHSALPLDVGHFQPKFFFRWMDKTEKLAVKSTQQKGNVGQ